MLSLPQLLHHARQLIALTRPADILAAACRGAFALTATTRGFATSMQPGQSWERGVLVQVTPDGAHEVSLVTRSALFAVHRRVAAALAPLVLARDPDCEPMFAGLGCGPHVRTIAAVPLMHRTGRLSGVIVLIGCDHVPDGVTELAELTTFALENAQRLAYARRDQDRLLLLSEATDEALWDWDIDANELWWGGGIAKLVGSTADPVENTPTWKVAQIHPDDRARVRSGLEAARTGEDAAWTAEYRFRRADGSYVDVEDRGYFQRDARGRAYRMIGAVRDVTALRAVLALEHQARAEAEAASRSKDEFLAMLGHELRNPLAPIITGLQLMRMRGGGGVDRELTVVERQAQHLIRLVDDLLDISRIAHGKIVLQKSRIETALAIAAAIEMASPLIEERRHWLEVDAPAHGLEVEVDRARFAQAISNLLTNAAKYTEPGGKITVRALRRGSEIEIAIRDTGIGIAPEMVPHVFTMFVQERQALDRARGGLGLGLSIVRSLVEMHGGSVAATSEGRGTGSEFTIRLPAADTTAIHVPESAKPRMLRPMAGRRIMVVDDNQDAADLLSLLLERLGNTTRVAHDASAALGLVADFQPELAVLDIGLPVMDGFELARRLRERPETRGMRLVALSGYGQASDQRRTSDAGFDAHLVKPIKIEALEAVIQRLLPGAAHANPR